MEEVDRITLENLRLLGCTFGDDEETPITSVAELTSEMIVEATSLCLTAIQSDSDVSYPRSLPGAMSARFKVGHQLASALKDLGFKGDLGYQTFLYPNARDSRNVLMFLVERLPKDSAQATAEDVLSSTALLARVMADAVKLSLQQPWLPYYCKQDGLRKVGRRYLVESCSGMLPFRSHPLLIPCHSWEEANAHNITFNEKMPPVNEQVTGCSNLAASLLDRNVRLLEAQRSRHSLEKRRSASKKTSGSLQQLVATSLKSSTQEASKLAAITARASAKPKLAPKPGQKPKGDESVSEQSQETKEQRKERLEKELNLLREDLNKHTAMFESLTSRLEHSTKEMATCQSELERFSEDFNPLERELDLKQKTHSLLPEAPDNIVRLNELVSKKQTQLVSLVAKWEEHRTVMLSEVRELREVTRSRQTVTQKLQEELVDLKQGVEECRVDLTLKEDKSKDIQKRLAAAQKASLTNQTQTRGDYTRRILDITENNRKQKMEITRVIEEILAVQRELNLLRGKLDRTYAVTDELVFRDAKTNETCRKMYKMLAGLHSNCEQLVEVIEDKGRLTREIRELEDQVEMESRKKTDENLSKIEADFHEIKITNKKLKELLKSSLK